MKLIPIKKLNEKRSTLFIVSKKGKVDVPTNLRDFYEAFKKSQKSFESFRLSDRTIAFGEQKKEVEQLRIYGYNFRKALSKEEKEVEISGLPEAVWSVGEGLALSNYQFLVYFKDANKRKYGLRKVGLKGVSADKVTELNNLVKAVSWTRDMVNQPLSYLTAEQLSKEIGKISDESGFKLQVLGKSKIESLKMGGLLAVNRGSIDPPTFNILEYKGPKPKNKRPIVLVGKGVVYDTGGLSLKPTAGSMDFMKSDMAGAACMAGAVYAAALNKLNVHIIALIPATDNRPGQKAYVPGDVITMYDGTTVEVLNTDAEGRMILADALAYSAKYDPELVVDAATLTGAAVAAIGTKASCMMGNASKKKMQQLERAGEQTHERVVNLPFWDEYLDEMKSSIADLKNIGGRYAGMITAGKFLEHFVKAPYIHLDIAGPSFLSSEENYKGKGGTGTGVRLLHEFLKNYE
ncbi:MAG: peptidase M17 [Bacteroidetes bacterium]|nr:MAG: peptidase M17 [Bacteroidota bacterium]